MEKRKWEKLSYKNTLKRIVAMRSQKKSWRKLWHWNGGWDLIDMKQFVSYIILYASSVGKNSKFENL